MRNAERSSLSSVINSLDQLVKSELQNSGAPPGFSDRSSQNSRTNYVSRSQIGLMSNHNSQIGLVKKSSQRSLSPHASQISLSPHQSRIGLRDSELSEIVYTSAMQPEEDPYAGSGL